jgi:hypothetical protein
MMKGEVEATTLKEPYVTLTEKLADDLLGLLSRHGSSLRQGRHLSGIRGSAPDQTVVTYEATSRRPISTNMLARAGSRKRSEMRVAR